VIEGLQALVVAFGPLGAMGMSLAVVTLYFYRRDFLRQRNGLREAHARRDVREEQMILVVKENAAAMADLTRGMDEFARSLREGQERHSRDLAEIIRAVRPP